MLEAGLISSAEFADQAAAAGLSVLELIYVRGLGRALDDTGRAVWGGQLAATGDVNGVALGILLSTERLRSSSATTSRSTRPTAASTRTSWRGTATRSASPSSAVSSRAVTRSTWCSR